MWLNDRKYGIITIGRTENKSEVTAMPMKPLKPCRHPGCPELTSDMYCTKHAPLYQRESAHSRGYNSKWRRISKLYLKAHPLCCECRRQGKLTPATVVDHIVPHRGNQKLMWDGSNWQSLCKQCHDRKTARFDRTPTYGYQTPCPRGVWISKMA